MHAAGDQGDLLNIPGNRAGFNVVDWLRLRLGDSGYPADYAENTNLAVDQAHTFIQELSRVSNDEAKTLSQLHELQGRMELTTDLLPTWATSLFASRGGRSHDRLFGARRCTDDGPLRFVGAVRGSWLPTDGARRATDEPALVLEFIRFIGLQLNIGCVPGLVTSHFRYVAKVSSLCTR